ncbi:MAG: NuoF family protein [Candidatus Hinthialibacter antarcticus]|nr:NuoF family protein [Candidatus Hinthialibacter antarcticus]
MTPDEIRNKAEEVREENKAVKHHVCVCMAAGCVSAGSDKVKVALDERATQEDDCCVKSVGCLGLCSAGPLVSVESDGVLYQKVEPKHADKIIDSLGKKPIKELQCDLESPFFKAQMKIVLENSGRIDPETIEDYLAVGGYETLIDVVTNWEPFEVVDEITKSGLRGRGGGGYPTGLKWGTVAKAEGPEKYIVCNADEGDPGAFMDRCILESDPHRVIEGMTLACFAVGATKGYVYIRAEYPLAIERLRNAIRQAKKMDVLGNNILGAPFNFDIEIRLGAGAFVCGEETALIASIEGSRGNPKPRPPYPAEKGVFGKPTLINNVETYANIVPILREGSEWYSSLGTESSKGTKVFALAGQIQNTGLIEVPMGISLREIVFDIGGGVPNGGKCKAVLTGGPSGGCIPESLLDIPVDYESLKELGSMMGSGGMIVMDESSNMVDVAQFFMEFCMSESCGKCVPCRVGTVQMHNLLQRISAGEATVDDLDLLMDLCELTRNTSLCGLGQSAPNPILSTLRFFRDEYTAVLKPSARTTVE